MTKITKMVLCFCLLLFASPLHAALGDLQVQELLAFANARFVDYNDSHAININYVGSSTEACLGITVGTITSQTPYGTADVNFGAGSDDGAYDFTAGAYNTLGELCDAIDFLTDYECTITEGKRDDNPTFMLDVTAASGSYDANAVGGYNVLFDSAATTSPSTPLARDLRIGIIPKKGHRVILKRCMINGNGQKSMEISGKLRRFEGAEDGITRNDTTIVWTSAVSGEGADEYYPVDDVTAQIGEWLEFAVNEHVVIGMDCEEEVDSTNLMWCEWIEK